MITIRGYVFLGLNGVRLLSIISLLLVFASSVVVLVHDIQAVNHFLADGGHLDVADASSNSTLTQDTDYIPFSTVPSQPAGAFWAVLNRLLIIFQVIVLLLSELGFPSAFFKTYFPILSDDFGLGALGVAQCLLGATILSHHVDTFSLASAWFLFTVGCINILLGLIFRQKVKDRRSIFAWRERAKDVLPAVTLAGHRIDPVETAERAAGYVKSKGWLSRTNSNTTTLADPEAQASSQGKPASLGFGRQAEKVAAAQGYLITRPVESRPRFSPTPSGRTTPL